MRRTITGSAAAIERNSKRISARHAADEVRNEGDDRGAAVSDHEPGQDEWRHEWADATELARG
jgi:hypothetical protein